MITGFMVSTTLVVSIHPLRAYGAIVGSTTAKDIAAS
jgi:hypothetical protein